YDAGQRARAQETLQNRAGGNFRGNAAQRYQGMNRSVQGRQNFAPQRSQTFGRTPSPSFNRAPAARPSGGFNRSAVPSRSCGGAGFHGGGGGFHGGGGGFRGGGGGCHGGGGGRR